MVKKKCVQILRNVIDRQLVQLVIRYPCSIKEQRNYFKKNYSKSRLNIKKISCKIVQFRLNFDAFVKILVFKLIMPQT